MAGTEISISTNSYTLMSSTAALDELRRVQAGIVTALADVNVILDQWPGGGLDVQGITKVMGQEYRRFPQERERIAERILLDDLSGDDDFINYVIRTVQLGVEHNTPEWTKHKLADIISVKVHDECTKMLNNENNRLAMESALVRFADKSHQVVTDLKGKITSISGNIDIYDTFMSSTLESHLPSVQLRLEALDLYNEEVNKLDRHYQTLAKIDARITGATSRIEVEHDRGGAIDYKLVDTLQNAREADEKEKKRTKGILTGRFELTSTTNVREHEITLDLSGDLSRNFGKDMRLDVINVLTQRRAKFPIIYAVVSRMFEDFDPDTGLFWSFNRDAFIDILLAPFDTQDALFHATIKTALGAKFTDYIGTPITHGKDGTHSMTISEHDTSGVQLLGALLAKNVPSSAKHNENLDRLLHESHKMFYRGNPRNKVTGGKGLAKILADCKGRDVTPRWFTIFPRIAEALNRRDSRFGLKLYNIDKFNVAENIPHNCMQLMQELCSSILTIVSEIERTTTNSNIWQHNSLSDRDIQSFQTSMQEKKPAAKYGEGFGPKKDRRDARGRSADRSRSRGKGRRRKKSPPADRRTANYSDRSGRSKSPQGRKSQGRKGRNRDRDRKGDDRDDRPSCDSKGCRESNSNEFRRGTGGSWMRLCNSCHRTARDDGFYYKQDGTKYTFGDDRKDDKRKGKASSKDTISRSLHEETIKAHAFVAKMQAGEQNKSLGFHKGWEDAASAQVAARTALQSNRADEAKSILSEAGFSDEAVKLVMNAERHD